MAFYPSAFRLDVISNYLDEAVSQLQNQYGFPQFYVIAHSMGGLVTRSFVKKYLEQAPENMERLGLVMTINSPMAGMASAATGALNPNFRTACLSGICVLNMVRKDA